MTEIWGIGLDEVHFTEVHERNLYSALKISAGINDEGYLMYAVADDGHIKR